MDRGPPDDPGGGRPPPHEREPDGGMQGESGAAGAATPQEPTSSATLCGPQDVSTRLKTEVSSASVTTPSDARRQGRGTVERREEDTNHQDRSGGSERTRISYAAAVRHGGDQQGQISRLPSVHKLPGNWKPKERSLLLHTLDMDWQTPSELAATPETAILRSTALAASEVRHDDMLRPRTALETKALLAYLNGSLELPHAPVFLKATMSLLQRAMMEQYHETHVEATLTAAVSPRVKLRRNMTHHALFGLLYQANADMERGKMMIRRMMDDVKMLHFDGIHTLAFVFHSRRLANEYMGLAVRLQGQCLELEDTSDGANAKILRPAQLRRRYSFRVYNHEPMGLVSLIATLGRIPGVEIVDAERPRVDSTEVIDNRYVLVYLVSQDCPAALRGVTKIAIGGGSISVHHHLLHPRLPCAKCYAPYHTTGFCKATPSQLERAHTRHKRVYEGILPHFHVGEAVQYAHTEGDSFNHFLDTLQREVEAEMGPPCKVHLGEPPVRLPRQETTANPGSTLTAAPSGAATDAEAGAAVPPAHGVGSDAAGYSVVRSKAAKAAEATRAHTAQQRAEGSHSIGMQGGQDDMQKAPVGKAKGKSTRGKGAAPNRQGFASFNRDRARGRFAELEMQDSDSEDDEEDRDDARDDAPYAYEGLAAEPLQKEQAHKKGNETAAEETTEFDLSYDVTMEEDSDKSSVISGYVGSSAPSQSCSYASTPGSEFPYSLASDRDDREEKTEENYPAASEVEDTTDGMGGLQENVAVPKVQGEGELTLSQDGVTIEKMVRSVGLPQQLPVFLRQFGGTLIEVPSNGQCAYSALYATTSYIEGGVLHFSSEAVRNANAIKRSIYTLMMTNLARDVECGVVDPRRELQRLYPLQPATADKATATASLYTHYAQERKRSVNTHIPSAFWAGAEVLRAMAQYLREPLFVFDVDANNDAHAQRYYFKNYTLASGMPHESGCGGAMDDHVATQLLKQYARLHVLPVMMVMKRHEGHFYGVHHGDIATRWLAEGDRPFAEANCATHEWFDEVIDHIEKSRTRVQQVDRLELSAEVDGIIVGAMEHRDRLDVVHERMGMPRLDGTALDIEYLECKLSAEGERLQQAAGPLHRRAERPSHTSAGAPTSGLRGRFAIAKQGRVALPPFQRILDSINLEPELVSDRSKLRHLLQANADAVETWWRRTPREERPGTFTVGTRALLSLMPWLIDHRPALQQVFAFIPYPELAAKQLPIKLLRQWGRLESYDAMIETISGVLHDSTASVEAAEHCRTWLAACTLGGGNTQDRTVAGERHRWIRLQQLHPTTSMGARPDTIAHSYWEILHTLPYTTWAWKAAMGDLPRGQLGHTYAGQPALHRLCQRIEGRAEWSLAAELPCGLTWDDRLTSMEAGMAAQQQY